jgi:hypothetical protein
VRRRTECVVRAGLGSLAGTVTYFGSYFVTTKLGFVQEKPAMFHVMMLIVILMCALLSTLNLPAMTRRADRDGSA